MLQSGRRSFPVRHNRNSKMADDNMGDGLTRASDACRRRIKALWCWPWRHRQKPGPGITDGGDVTEMARFF